MPLGDNGQPLSGQPFARRVEEPKSPVAPARKKPCQCEIYQSCPQCLSDKPVASIRMRRMKRKEGLLLYDVVIYEIATWAPT